MKPDRRRFRASPWLCGAAVALLYCAGYFFSWGLRSVYQSHYPEIVKQWAADGPYTLLGLYGTELGAEELAYASKTQESANHFWPYDGYILENKNIRGTLQDAASYIVMGTVQRATGNMTVTWLILRLLCCLVWFVCLERMAMALTGGNAAASRFCAAFIVCFSYVLTFIWVKYVRLTGASPAALLAKDAWTMLSIGRTESVYRLSRPGLTYCFLFAASLAEARAAARKELRWGLLAGLCGGVLAYVHFDVWSAFLVTAFVFAAAAWLKPGLCRRNLALAALVSAALSLPYILANYPPDPDLMVRASVIMGHRLTLESVIYCALGLAALAVSQGPMEVWTACLVAGCGFTMASPLITGKDFQFGHARFFANIFVVLFVVGRAARSKKAFTRAWDLAAAACVFAAFAQGIGYAAIHYPMQGLRRDDADALAWLRQDAPKQSVVVALSPEVNMLVPVFTDDKVIMAFSTPLYSDYPLISLTRRIRASLALLGVDQDRFFKELMASDYVDRRLIDMRAVPEQDYLKNIYFFSVPNELIRSMWRRAGDLAAPPFQRDFVWVGPFERRYLGARFPKGCPMKLRQVYANPTVTLYRIEGEPRLIAQTSKESRVSR